MLAHGDDSPLGQLMSRDLAVVIVNFNSGEYLAGCIESLAPALQGGIEADIVVVDNASPVAQTHHLAGAQARGARVFCLDRNTGYAGGCNYGCRITDGRCVLLLNADVRACPGAVAALLRHLDAHADVGIAEPRCYIDDGRQWLQPGFRPITPAAIVAATLGRASARIARRGSRHALRRQIAGWRAAAPYHVTALSGAFLAARRAVLEQVGGFDERYPLAYEDTDLFRRVRARGWKLTLVPAAEAIHYAHRSRVTVLAESLAKDRRGRHLYLRQHHGRWAEGLDRACGWLESRLARRWRAPPAPFLDLGTCTAPAHLALAGAPGPFVLQLAYDPSFSVFAGHFGHGSSYDFPAVTWRSLLATSIYVRAFALEDLEPRGAFVFRPG